MPRGQGFQEFQWPLDIVLRLKTSSQVDNLDQLMSAFVDAVVTVLLAAPMPIVLTDPVTGRETQMWSIGESGKISNPPGRTATDERALQYDAGIAVMVKEVVQA